MEFLLSFPYAELQCLKLEMSIRDNYSQVFAGGSPLKSRERLKFVWADAPSLHSLALIALMIQQERGLRPASLARSTHLLRFTTMLVSFDLLQQCRHQLVNRTQFSLGSYGSMQCQVIRIARKKVDHLLYTKFIDQGSKQRTSEEFEESGSQLITSLLCTSCGFYGSGVPLCL